MTDPLVRVEAALAARQPARVAPGLERIRALLDLLGRPESAYPSIHVTGTNGKTTTARMIDALLRELGLRTGRYTSPHLESVTERICVDGERLDAERFAAVHDEIAPYVALVDARTDQPVTYFELLTAMAFAAFADAPVDVAVVEVGMGGEWDATNVVSAPVAVVTPIALDHPELGPTLADKAREKAGIVHAGSLLVTAQQPVPAAEPLLRRAAEVGATVAREGIEFGVLARQVAVGGQQVTLRGLSGVVDDVYLPLHGRHQASNAATALAAVEAFVAEGRRTLDPDAVRTAFARVTSPGRLERARRTPTVLLDVAHNPAGARATADALREEFDFARLVGVVGMLADKDVRGVLEALDPVLDFVVATTNSSPRALPARALGAIAIDVLGPGRVQVVPGLADAIDAAIALAEEGGLPIGAGVLVTGSVVTVGEARRLLRVAV